LLAGRREVTCDLTGARAAFRGLRANGASDQAMRAREVGLGDALHRRDANEIVGKLEG
jgi:hypothetical protein